MTDKRPMVRMVRSFMHKHPRRERGLASVMAILGPIALLLMVALVPIHLGSRAAMAAVGPLAVDGHIYASGGVVPVVGATVIVSILVGTSPRATQLTSSDSNGFYSVTFSNAEWDVGNTILVVASDGVNEGQNSLVIPDESPSQTVDVTLGTTIPELGGPAVTALTVIAIGMMVVLYARRRRPSSP